MVVSWTTSEVVYSSDAVSGGPESIVLGDRDVPRYLEQALFRQPVGSRIQVVYAPDLFDLPEGLSPEDAFVLAVDIIG